jgi:PHD/YefM family antitoxin component YafN of YafNO toxin-antitoxin module
MPAKPKRVKEAKTPYRARRKPTRAKASPAQVTLRWSDIEQAIEPVMLERDGQPVAVVLRYDEYQRLDAERAERREKAWQELNKILGEMHSLTKDVPQEEIEADITAAREEVRELHRQQVTRQ